ncbi:MAG TPA: response regulator [Tepidisphaeraceae bacterium]|nr:response regulator [Tepidisphaeraceae bacterium]
MATVLVVDDHSGTRNGLVTLLQRWGYRALTAPAADVAFVIVNTEKPDLVILDEMMPGMTGLEFLQRLHAMPSTAELPVIVYSASDSRRLAADAIRYGAKEFWLKGKIEPALIQQRLLKYITPLPPHCARDGRIAALPY